MGPTLELRNLVKDFPGQRAVAGISLSVPGGSFFSLVGPSGCGKTTTLRLIAGFEQPTSGDVLLRGTVVNGRKPYERNVSTVFQSYALFPHLTVRQNVEFGLRQQRSRDIERRVEEILALVSLTGKEARRPAQLSGGERQRVALARSLVLQPDVLLLDEPLAALDPKLRKQMRLELKATQRRVGISFLLVTHDQEEAISLSDQLAVMNDGVIEQVGTPEDLYLRPRTRFVADFLGAMNWIGGIGIRPGAIGIVNSSAPETHRQAAGLVTGSVFLGDRVEVLVKLETGEEVTAQVSRNSAVHRQGDAVRIHWDPSEEIRF
jgi:ABC-type Fe3+/spermidine/putrescine transport system ATPase subunit